MEELKENGTVTSLSVIGLVFGLIGLAGSSIPCIGSMAYQIGIPASLVSGLALWIAKTKNAKQTLAIAALTISLIGSAVSGWQYYEIISAGERARQNLIRMGR